MIRGVNYPWRHYGGDFGVTVWGHHAGVGCAVEAIADDCATMVAHGVSVVRWFVFADGRGGLQVDAAGWPDGIQPAALDDLDTALALARAAGLQVVPVLFDHPLAFRASEAAGARVGGHGQWLADPEGHARLLERIVEPVVARYGPHGARADLAPAIHAWDLLNEPDWIIAELNPSSLLECPVAFDVFAAWVREAAGVVHRHHGLVTIGGARLRFTAWWDEPQLQLDFLQAHAYYDPRHDFDLLATPLRALGVTRPVVIGECAGQGEAADPGRDRPALSLRALARAARVGGYHGLWPWSWRGVDAHGAVAGAALAELAADDPPEAGLGYRMPIGARSGSGHDSPS